MKSGKFKFGDLVAPIALIVIGLLFAIFPDRSTTVVCYCVGVVLCVLAALKLYEYFTVGRQRVGSRELAYAVFCIGTALILFTKPELVAGIMTLIFGMALIVNGALKMQLFADLCRFRSPKRWAVLAVAAISFVLGAVMVFDPFSSGTALMVFAGVSLIVDGALDLLATLFIENKREVDESKVIDLDDDDISGI